MFWKMGLVITAVLVSYFALGALSIDTPGHQPSLPQEVLGEFHKFESFVRKAANHCVCDDYNCGCCAHLVEKQIHLDSTICTNATYLKRDYGFSLTVTFNNYTVFNETMSLRNPPPICMGAPFVKELAEVCVRIYDIQATKAHLHACVEVEAHLKHVHIAKYELGCFNMEGSELQKALEQLENEIL